MPIYSISKLVTMIKILTVREILKLYPPVKKHKKQLWGGEFWSGGYFASTVGKHGDEKMVARYVQNQSNTYEMIYESRQLRLF